jgi:transcriptional regulator with XRE-family HTH domain
MRKSNSPFHKSGLMATRETSDPWEQYVRELGINLARARQAAGLSQEKVAHAAGISTFTYRKLEKGESNPGTPANPRLRTLANLAEVLNISIVALLTRDSDSR